MFCFIFVHHCQISCSVCRDSKNGFSLSRAKCVLKIKILPNRLVSKTDFFPIFDEPDVTRCRCKNIYKNPSWKKNSSVFLKTFLPPSTQHKQIDSQRIFDREVLVRNMSCSKKKLLKHDHKRFSKPSEGNRYGRRCCKYFKIIFICVSI